MIRVLKVTPATVRIHLATVLPDQARDWIVDRADFGSIGGIRATTDDGDVCTLGMFRSRDGTAMHPEYARLRKLLGGTAA